MSPKAASKNKKRIFLVDDHAVVRDGLRWIVERDEELEVCGEAEDAAEAMKKINDCHPDLIIIDIALTGTSGIDLAREIRANSVDTRILMLSMYKESLYAERALRAGANGYLMKRDGGAKLVAALHHILSGHTYVSHEINEALLQQIGGAKKPGFSIDRLTNRELEVFRLIGLGHGSKEIAASLGISMKTIEAHRENIRGKLNLVSGSDLVQHAIHWVHSESIPQ